MKDGLSQKTISRYCPFKAFKRIRRKHQEYFAVYGEYADRHKTEPISANFR